ncbi:MAG: response regulator transcription factor [Deltaproteobacteria bacterium]|nr:response regulator transcription factor [Deltaproteobacteria bacterium]
MKEQSNSHTIAVIEDDESVRRSLVLNLELEGFKVVTAQDGEEGISVVNEHHPDLIILDVMMPKKDGLQTCKELRNAGISTPLILLTARSAEVDKVLGLELGADDYLAKPFGMLELIARLKALLRRVQHVREIDKVNFDDVTIDFKAYRAERNQQPLELSAREYRLLQYLVAKSGSVVTRDELLDEVWGYNSYPSTRTVDNHIARLRQKIESNVDDPKHILTVHGVGYKFVA